MYRSKLFLIGCAIMLSLSPLRSADITEGQILQAKAVLDLRPDQERLWPRVATAIRNFARDTRQPAGDNTLKRDAAAAKRVLAAAQPLLKTMSATQRQSASALVRSLGFTERGEKL